MLINVLFQAREKAEKAAEELEKNFELCKSY